MADRPTIFSAPMIRALRECRKTQTRRVLTPQPGDVYQHATTLEWRERHGVHGSTSSSIKLRFAPGDRLWVRETWQTGMGPGGPQITFRATPDFFPIDAWTGPNEGRGPSFDYDKCPGATWHTYLGDLISGVEGAWRSPIHMPRWASRLTLIVESVKVERLQNISEEDALAEGVVFETADPPFYYVPGVHPHSITAVGIEERCSRPHAITSFAKLWQHIHGPGEWEMDPYVAAIQFRAVSANIDTLDAAGEPLRTEATA